MSSCWLLCLATMCSILNAFAQNIVSLLLSITHQDSPQCRKLQREMIDIKKEMNQISMVDEFARHARLQRKLIKLQQEWKGQANVINSSKMKAKLMLTLSVRTILGFAALFLVYQYHSVPVLELPTEWFGPLSSFLSWPTGQEGTLSLMSWFLICGSVTQRFASMLS